MGKRVWLIFGVIAIALTTYVSYSLLQRPKYLPGGYCPFCDPEVLERQKFYEDELVYALSPYKPLFPGHSLVIPKRHVQQFQELTDAESDRICQVIKKVDRAVKSAYGTSPYFLLQKNGYEVGQSVFHVHVHYIPRQAGDDSFFVLGWKFFAEQFRRPEDPKKLRKTVERMRASMQAEAFT